MSMTSRLLHQINEVWESQGDDEHEYLTEVRVCSEIYDVILQEGILKEMEFDPNEFNGLDGDYFTIPIIRDDGHDILFWFVYE